MGLDQVFDSCPAWCVSGALTEPAVSAFIAATPPRRRTRSKGWAGINTTGQQRQRIHGGFLTGAWCIAAAAEGFHEIIRGEYHPVTYVHYGADSEQASFESVNWRLRKGLRPDSLVPPTATQVKDMGFEDVRDFGRNPLYVGGKIEAAVSYGSGIATSYQFSYWELVAEMQDGAGDGTVPASSGCAPIDLSRNKKSIRQQFQVSRLSHDPSYKNGQVQLSTLFGIQKIASEAKGGE